MFQLIRNTPLATYREPGWLDHYVGGIKFSILSNIHHYFTVGFQYDALLAAFLLQPQWQRTRVSHQVKVSAPGLPASSSASEISSIMWPRQDEATRRFSHSEVGASTPIVVNPNMPRMGPVSIQQDDGPPDNLV